jgi:OOP family OmpA-OmpF porin
MKQIKAINHYTSYLNPLVMKKSKLFKLLLAAMLVLSGVGSAMAQRGTSIGVFGSISEYKGDLSGSKFYQFDHPLPGGGLFLQHYLNRSFNLMERYSYTQVQYDAKSPENWFYTDFHSLDLNLKYKLDNGYLFNEDAAVAPFLTGGVGAIGLINSNRDGTDEEIVLNFKVGAGILFRFNDRVGLEISNTLNLPGNDTWDGVKGGDNDMYLQHNLGLVFGLRKAQDADGDGVPDKRDKCPDTPPGVVVDSKGCPVDLDGDGVPDYLDQCKTEPGTKELFGCPDRDGDGIADKDDKCPEVAGLARFGGCPDTDGDGIEDSKDRCPNVPGLDIFQGCPDTDGDGVEDAMDKCPDTKKGIKVDANGCPADTDGDGVIDSEDKCPTTPGDPKNQGCPVIKEEVKKRLQFATRGINFETGKATLKTTSYPMLDEIIAILNEYKDYNLRIGGHTDNVGKDEANMLLSQARVDAVKSYLMVKGQVPESRLEATGYGASRPIASNKTAAGTAQNRRVELELYLK